MVGFYKSTECMFAVMQQTACLTIVTGCWDVLSCEADSLLFVVVACHVDKRETPLKHAKWAVSQN